MKSLIASAAAVALILAGCSGEPQMDLTGKASTLAKTIAAEQDHVSVPELSDWMIKDQRDFELVDIRDAADFEAGHIDGARHVPLAGLMADEVLASLPTGRKVVVYSNGTAHAAQAALLLRLVERDAYALLGGFNYWQAYLRDPATAGTAQMDPKTRAQYQAVSCYFEGDYIADAGLTVKGGGRTAVGSPPAAAQTSAPAADPLGLGLGLGLGSEDVRDSVAKPAAAAPAADPLGLGLDLGLGGEAADAVRQKAAAPKASPRKLLIKAEC